MVRPFSHVRCHYCTLQTHLACRLNGRKYLKVSEILYTKRETEKRARDGKGECECVIDLHKERRDRKTETKRS